MKIYRRSKEQNEARRPSPEPQFPPNVRLQTVFTLT